MKHPMFRILSTALLAWLFTAPLSPALGRRPDEAPRLPRPTGQVVRVSNVEQLYRAVATIESNTTIMLARGEYRLHRPVALSRPVKNVAIRGATGQFSDIVLRGAGMNNEAVWHGIMAEKVDGLLIADLSIGEVGYHPITVKSQCRRLHVYHCRLFDAGEQFVKTNSGGNGRGSDFGIVEYSVIEYTRSGPADGYTNGVDVHGGDNWAIRHNLFRNIRTPRGAQYKNVPAVLMWNGAKDTVCEANTFLNCDRAIAFGLVRRNGFQDHEGGVIRNNFVYGTRQQVPHIDAGITVCSPGTKVLHNTVLHNGGYENAIEARFPGTTGVQIAGNLVDGRIAARNDAQVQTAHNVTDARGDAFRQANAADLHLLRRLEPVPLHKDCREDFDGVRRSARTMPGADQ